MVRVGIRSLKTHLSEYLQRVKAGEKLTITDRGKDVATIVPSPAKESEAMVQLRKLGEKGLIIPSGRGPKPGGLEKPIKLPRSKWVSKAVLEARR